MAYHRARIPALQVHSCSVLESKMQVVGTMKLRERTWKDLLGPSLLVPVLSRFVFSLNVSSSCCICWVSGFLVFYFGSLVLLFDYWLCVVVRNCVSSEGVWMFLVCNVEDYGGFPRRKKDVFKQKTKRWEEQFHLMQPIQLGLS